jgi:hypothetical protein
VAGLLLLVFLGGCAGRSPTTASSIASVDVEGVGVISKGSPSYPTIISIPVGSATDPKALNGTSREYPVIGLILGPGLYRTAAYVGVLKAFEKQRIPVQILGGVEMGAVVAALYAKSRSSNVLEWDIFRAFEKLPRNNPILGKKWRDWWGNWLTAIFEGRAMESLALMLIIPAYDTANGNVEYFRRGEISPLLITSLDVFQTSEQLLSPIHAEIFDPGPFREQGAEFVIGLDVLSCGINFKKGDGHIVGLYQRTAAKIIAEKDRLDGFWGLDLGDIDLDDTTAISKLIRLGEKQGETMATQLKEKFKKLQTSDGETL